MNTIITSQLPDQYNHVVYLIEDKNQLTDLALSTALKSRFETQLEDAMTVSYTGLEGIVSVVVCGDIDDQYSELEKIRDFGSKLCNEVNAEKGEVLVIRDLTDTAIFAFALSEGILLTNYSFDKYKKDAKAPSLTTLVLEDASEELIASLEASVNGTCIARDLVNEPQSYLTAEKLSTSIMALGSEIGFSVEVFNKSKIAALKMGGLLAVNKGSVAPPTFTVMDYNPEGAINGKPIVLVGKGIVYDTGGLSLKPTPNSMDFMKSDMGGAAAVIGAISAIAKAKIPVRVVGLVPATDNRPGGDAYAPGDVITMSDGTTVEVLNTDAEGRLVLADALLYAKKYDPELVVDVATLTGAALVAVGTDATAAMGTLPTDVMDLLKDSGMRTHERIVELPLWDDYKELLKSQIADISNLGGRDAGTITAGKFLEHFTDYPWVHLDIAGPGYVMKPKTYRKYGGSGVGVRLLFDFIQDLALGEELE